MYDSWDDGGLDFGPVETMIVAEEFGYKITAFHHAVEAYKIYR